MAIFTMKEARSTVSTILLGAQLQAAKDKDRSRRPHVDLTAGEVHNVWIGGLKPNRMPMVCNAMKQLMRTGDVILEQPPSGQGPRLRIRYYLEVDTSDSSQGKRKEGN